MSTSRPEPGTRRGFLFFFASDFRHPIIVAQLLPNKHSNETRDVPMHSRPREPPTVQDCPVRFLVEVRWCILDYLGSAELVLSYGYSILLDYAIGGKIYRNRQPCICSAPREVHWERCLIELSSLCSFYEVIDGGESSVGVCKPDTSQG